MSRWNRRGWRERWNWYPPAPPKQPPPEHGIKVKQIGATWWGQRWIEALERFSREYSNRLGRGRTYARAGRVHDLQVRGGVVTARVTGSRAAPYKVTMRVASLSAPAWKQAIEQLAEQALFAAELLASRMPQQIDEAFRAAGASLFPERAADLTTECSCPDWANPCKHIAATHYVLGEAFDKDPFLLFELRGRNREQVLGQLRALRAGESSPAPAARGGRAAAARHHRTQRAPNAEKRALAVSSPPGSQPGPQARIPGLCLAGRKPATYETWAAPVDGLRFRVEAAAAPGALLRQLGLPPSWSAQQTPAEVFAPMCAAAAALARALAVQADDEGAAP